jgi:hypothetical protein
MEARAMIRRTFFALVLVAAAFGGGAAINGPGLTWIKGMISSGPSIIVDGRSSSNKTPKAPKQFPSAKPRPLLADMATAKPPVAKVVPPAPAPVELPPASESAAALLRVPAATVALADAKTPPVASPAAESSPAPAPHDLGPGGEVPKADPVTRRASAVPVEPAAPGPSRDWTEIRARMKALGVARYAIDAELDGRVRFTCVIPVDGLRAVGHHFEAEGDDEAEAIEAALRRVALWKATEEK